MLPAGQTDHAAAFTDVMSCLRVSPPVGPALPGGTLSWPGKTYSSRAIREHLCRRGIRAVVPASDDQRDHRIRRGGRPVFDRQAYKERSTVERCINRLKAIARPVHSIRQDRNHLPRLTPHCRHLYLVGTMIQKKFLKTVAVLAVIRSGGRQDSRAALSGQ
ncbi:hypothetical protein OG875_19440 [Streptomyces sp. NBC_01498]|uniref:hypothetical protein n=1 Tax=Streptomyces sp. NBC_01498 TaxID=2975870 RepID=UPI002E7AE537|nr:hypothetical protein [Streptomyces sp. NBC_01498]WTL26551.1 hypothetical protein OG875_19440 [Streptomyces sp. NBC_01498]